MPNAVSLWFEDLGDRSLPAVLLISSANATSMCWPAVLLDHLTHSGFRVIRYDHRDIGLSSWPIPRGNPYSLDDLTADAAALVDHLGIPRCHVVGLSMGGIIAQRLAISSPGLVDRCVLVASSPDPAGRTLSSRSPALNAEIAALSRQSLGPVDRALAVYAALSGPAFDFDERWYRRMIEDDVARGTNPTPAHGVALSTAQPWIELLGQIQAPTLIVHGTADASFPIDHGRALAAGIPNSSLIEWADVGHELPPALAADFAKLVVDHLRGVDAGHTVSPP